MYMHGARIAGGKKLLLQAGNLRRVKASAKRRQYLMEGEGRRKGGENDLDFDVDNSDNSDKTIDYGTRTE